VITLLFLLLLIQYIFTFFFYNTFVCVCLIGRPLPLSNTIQFSKYGPLCRFPVKKIKAKSSYSHLHLFFLYRDDYYRENKKSVKLFQDDTL
jgi:hypothetical protein